MNVRKIALFILCATIVAGAEEKLNIFGAAGFGFGTGGFRMQSETVNIDRTTADREDHYFNYGQGLKLDLGIQYYLMENLALQVGFGMSGRVPRLTTEFHELLLLNASNNTTTTYKSSLFGVKVMVVPRFEILELTNMYAGVGVGFFWNTLRYESDSVFTTTTLSRNATETGKYTSSPKLGLLGLLGIDYPLSDALCAFGELAFEQVSFTWKKKTSESSSGKRTTNYEKDAANLDSPERIPGSNWQIRFGVRLAVL